MRLLGFPQPPGPDALRPVEHALRRGFSLPAVADSCTPAQEYNHPGKIPTRTVWGSKKSEYPFLTSQYIVYYYLVAGSNSVSFLLTVSNLHLTP